MLTENIDLNSKQIVKVVYPYEQWEDPTTKTVKCALNIAIDKQNIDIINLLLSHSKIRINDQKDEYLDYISPLNTYVEGRGGEGWYHSMPLIQELMDYPGSNFHFQKGIIKPALCYAIQNEQFEIAKAILSSGKDLDVNAEIIINKYTAKKDKKDISDIDKFVWSPCAKTIMPALCIAIEKNSFDIVKLLLSSPKIDVNTDYLRESYSYINDEKEEEEEDTNTNKDVNWIYEKGIESPLHMAVESSNKEIIKLLLQNKKIDLNKVDDKNKKAIEYAQNDEIKELFQKFK